MRTRILGIDPGSRTTGYAILDQLGSDSSAACCDVIHFSQKDTSFERLRILYSEVSRIISFFKPDYCAIETPVYGKDPSAMLKLGRAQAAIIMSVLHQDIPLFEYYPKAVKKAVTGRGNANKEQVAFMLYKLISISETKLPNDASDALAVAWCLSQKLRDPSGNRVHSPEMQGKRNRNTWASFIENHPDRIHKK